MASINSFLDGLLLLARGWRILRGLFNRNVALKRDF